MIRLLKWALPRFGDVVVILMALGLGGMAWAAPPVVKTVPWVASNPLIPHDAWNGKQITLKGTADVQGGNIAYTWDFGDGSPVATGTVTNQYIIDTIQRYQWDLDGTNDFADANGPQPDVTGYFGGRGVGNYLVQLKVTDNTATSFPSSGQPDLSSTDIAQVSVKDASDAACKCITDLSARAKSSKVGTAVERHRRTPL